MTQPSTLWLYTVLLTMGAGWGFTVTLTKVAVSTGHQYFGLIAWQFVVMAAILLLITKARNKPIPFTGKHVALYLMICLLGGLIPNSITYAAAAHLPAGIMAILLSTVPLFAFPIAIALRTDAFDWMRTGGLLCGIVCVALIVGPDTALPDPSMVIFVLLALISPLFYAVEGNIIAKWGTMDLDPVQVLTGASLVGIPFAFALAGMTGQVIDPRLPWAAPELALIGSAAIHVVVYATYFWTVAKAGAVFAAQVAYPVTAFGVIGAIVFLGERYSLYIWAGFALMLAGLFLVQPRLRSGLAPSPGMGKDIT
jgi:drug/metabolite transporter (DMT)-like permease